MALPCLDIKTRSPPLTLLSWKFLLILIVNDRQGMLMAKKSPVVPSRFKAKYAALNNHTKSLIKLIVIALVLIGLGLTFHFNTDQSIPSTERFFEQRKNVQEYHEYKQEEESAKKRAEKNIFLQN
ncbi:MAG: cytoskeletal protein RodZ [Bermanella sp.]